MKRIASNLIAILLMAIFCVFLILGNVFRVSVPVATAPGSYAEKYAKQHNLKQVSIPDTLKEGRNLHYETFSYNTSGSSATLEKYKGIGTEIVIPQRVDGYAVRTIGEKFFVNSPSIKKVYLPESLDEIEGEAMPGIVLVVAAGSSMKETLTEAGWEVETFNDTERPIFTLGEIPYEYNETDSEIELVAYTGSDSTLLLPAYINGKPVTAVSFNMLGYDLIAFPETVTKITGATYLNLYTRAFAVELAFTVLAFVIVLIVMNVKLPKLSDNKEHLLTGPQIVLTYLFFAAQIAFALLVIYKGIVGWLPALLISACLLAVYLILLMLAGHGRKQAITVEENTKKRTSRMDGLKLSAATLSEGITDKEVKKQVERVMEEIRFSDPTTNEGLNEIEQSLEESIKALKESINTGNTESILQKCSETIRIVKERNAMCKAYK